MAFKFNPFTGTFDLVDSGGGGPDPFPQYLFLPGRTDGANNPLLSITGDGTVTGSSASLGSLILQATNNADGKLGRVIASPGTTTIESIRAYLTLGGVGLTFSAAGSTIVGMELGSANTAQQTWLIAATTLFGNFCCFVNPLIINSPTTTARTFAGFGVMQFNPNFRGDGALLTITTNHVIDDAISTSQVNTGTVTITDHTTVSTRPSIGASGTITARRGLWYRDQVFASAGAVPTSIAVDVENITSSGAFTVAAALRSAVTAGTNKFFLNDTGGAQSAFAGLITKYNNISTVSNGIPSELATIDTANLSALVAATNLYLPTATGLYRITVSLQVTTAATTSSILGGTTGVVIVYTDGDSSVAQSAVVPMSNQAGNTLTTANGNIGNSTTTNSKGTIDIYAKTGVQITYAIGYTSVGVTAMVYAAHLKVEAL